MRNPDAIPALARNRNGDFGKGRVGALDMCRWFDGPTLCAGTDLLVPPTRLVAAGREARKPSRNNGGLVAPQSL